MRRHHQRFLVVFVLFLLSLGFTWAVIQPPYGVSDEPAHTVKALASSRGDLSGPHVIGQFDYEAIEFIVPSAYSSIWHFVCYNSDPNVTPDCAPPFPTSSDRTAVSSTAGEYPPLYYAIVGWLGWLSPGQDGLTMMRVMTVFLVVAMAGFASWLIHQHQERSGADAILLGLTPTVLAFSGTVNPFGPEIAAAILFWTSSLLLLGETSSRKQLRQLTATVYGSAILLGFIRPASFVWIVVIMLFVLTASPTPEGSRLIRPVTRHVIAASTTGVLVSYVWFAEFMTTHSLGGGSPAGGTLLGNMRFSFERTDEYLRQTLGFFGWTSFYSPPIVIVLYMALLVLFVVFYRMNHAEVRLSLLCLVLFACLGPSVLEGARASTSGFGFQGRYLLPVLVGFPLILVCRSKTTRPSHRQGVLLGGLVLAQLFALNHATRRFTVGLDGPYLWPIHMEWSGNLGALATLTFTAVTWLLGGLLLLDHTRMVQSLSLEQ